MKNLMAKPWEAQFVLEMPHIRQLLARDLPARAQDPLCLLGEGWDNWVYLLQDPTGQQNDLTLRFPRRDLALELMDQEWSALTYLAPRLPIEVPEPQIRGSALEGVFPWPYAVYSMISGETACRAELSLAERQALIPALAQALKGLHSLQKDLPDHLPGDLLQRADLAQRKPRLKDYLQQALPLLDDGEWLWQWWQDLPEQTPAQRPRCLVHGDLYARHLIVNAAHELQGIIDWGDVHLGDPALDLSLVYAYLPPESHGQFWRIYGEVSEDTKMMARFRAVYSCLYLLVYGADIGDQALLNVARQGLKWLQAYTG